MEGLTARWKIAPGRVDKTQQAYFQVNTDTTNISDVKGWIDHILQHYEYHLQGSYIPQNSNCIFYHFLNLEHITKMLQNPIIIDNWTYYPHRSHYIQPIYSLEIAITGMSKLYSARSIIDSYIEHKFKDGSPHPIVHHSCLMLDDSVYCAVLLSPEITQWVLATGNNFQPFAQFNITPNKPQYLYALNASGIPLTVKLEGYTRES